MAQQTATPIPYPTQSDYDIMHMIIGMILGTAYLAVAAVITTLFLRKMGLASLKSDNDSTNDLNQRLTSRRKNICLWVIGLPTAVILGLIWPVSGIGYMVFDTVHCLCGTPRRDGGNREAGGVDVERGTLTGTTAVTGRELGTQTESVILEETEMITLQQPPPTYAAAVGLNQGRYKGSRWDG